MTPADIRTARKALGLTQEGLARALTIHPMMVSKWERGISKAPPYLHLVFQALRDLARERSTQTPAAAEETGR